MKTGGGHLAPAKAIKDAIGRASVGKAVVELFDGLHGCNKMARFLIEDGYRILQSRARWYFALLYFFNKFLPLAWFSVVLVSMITKPVLRRKIMDTKPDKIVIFHFFLIKPTLDILRTMNDKTPVVIVVTDPSTAHPIWFLWKTCHYVVFSERLRNRCIRSGIREHKVSVFPFPVSNKYVRLPTRAQAESVRERLGIQGKTVLIFGGGDGMPRGERIFRLLLKIKGLTILMVCGRNGALLKRVEDIASQGYRERVRLFGYVDFVDELIGISDLVISKCGASTFMEILLLEKLPVVTDYMWEQEKGNVEFLQKHRLGFFEPNLRKLPALIESLLADEDLSASIRSNIRSLKLRSGSDEIAHWLMNTGAGNEALTRPNLVP
jgi:UDP-N-acetylglucosamine:LPS N-acetylglucosamine transferase